jgi:hypothetical protein
MDIVLICDGLPFPGVRTTTHIATRHCKHFVAHFLHTNTAVTVVLADKLVLPPPSTPPRWARFRARCGMWQVGLVRLLVESVAATHSERKTQSGPQSNFVDGWILDPSSSPLTWALVPALSQIGARRDHFAFSAGGQVVFGSGTSPTS